jgi:hypothetical protein
VRREVELEQRLHSLEALGDAVGAMKSLSAHHYRQVRQAVKPARTYREGVERMVRSVGAGLGEGPGGAGLLVIGAELWSSEPVAAASWERAPPSASGGGPRRS